MRPRLRVLVVEDNSNDAELLVRHISRAYEVSHQRVETKETMVEALRRSSWDLVVSDHSLPTFDARSALAIVQEAGIDLPFIVVSGSIGEDAAVDALRAGAHDFVTKDSLAR